VTKVTGSGSTERADTPVAPIDVNITAAGGHTSPPSVASRGGSVLDQVIAAANRRVNFVCRADS
jgi:hypothetical protein